MPTLHIGEAHLFRKTCILDTIVILRTMISVELDVSNPIFFPHVSSATALLHMRGLDTEYDPYMLCNVHAYLRTVVYTFVIASY